MALLLTVGHFLVLFGSIELLSYNENFLPQWK